MKHFGDITNIKGNEVPSVDIITGGSPCQDLSVAGKRKGLDGERSGLFMEQIRVTKEMRDESIRQLRMRGADVDFRLIKPRFMVWENVPGAFSSNKGEDFRAVLEEICRIKDKDATIPMPKKGKWSTSGCIVGDGYSVAWRVHDAQFWGVPQRRKRIALVADFGGESAPEILFECKGLSGNTEEGREEGQGVARDTERGVDKTISFQERAGKPGGGKGILIQDERTGALSTSNNQSVCYGISSYDSNAMKSSNPHSGIYEANTTRTLDNNGGNPACNQGGMIVLEGNGSRPSHKGEGYKESDVSYTLNSTEQHAVCFEPGSMSRVGGHYYEDGKSGTLRANAGDNQMAVCIDNHAESVRNGQGVDVYNGTLTGDTASTLTEACGGTNTSGAKALCEKYHPTDNIENQTYQSTVGALCATDYKGAGNQYVNEGKCIVQNVQRGNGQLSQARISEKVGALNCMHDQQAVLTYMDDTDKRSDYAGTQDKIQKIRKSFMGEWKGGDGMNGVSSVVRRLTPL